jgi:hypothetical protein
MKNDLKPVRTEADPELARGHMSLAEALAQPDSPDFEFKPRRLAGIVKPADAD